MSEPVANRDELRPAPIGFAEALGAVVTAAAQQDAVVLADAVVRLCDLLGFDAGPAHA